MRPAHLGTDKSRRRPFKAPGYNSKRECQMNSILNLEKSLKITVFPRFSK